MSHAGDYRGPTTPTLKLLCPICQGLTEQVLETVGRTERTRTDMQPLDHLGRSGSRNEILTCLHCGLSARAEELDKIRGRVANDDWGEDYGRTETGNALLVAIAGAELTGTLVGSWGPHHRAEVAARLLEADNTVPGRQDRAPARVIADAWLTAAWLAVEASGTTADVTRNAHDRWEEERFYRVRAARWYDRALHAPAGSDDARRCATAGEKATVAYLLGEQRRRVADRAGAAAAYQRCIHFAGDAGEQGIVQLARTQRDCPVEWIEQTDVRVGSSRRSLTTQG